MLEGKNILIGITGSIAAYKAAFLVREFRKLNANVKVVMTPSASEFITPLTLSTLSNNPVANNWSKDDETWTNHVELGMWADLFLIAPCTANTLSKMCTGLCDNLLMGVYLSAKCPVAFAPAMDLDMYKHFSTQENIDKLISKGYFLIDSEEGELASGLHGKGRMAEPENILAFVKGFFKTPPTLVQADKTVKSAETIAKEVEKNPEKTIIEEVSPIEVEPQRSEELKGKRILITAGPTHEDIDPVRFIGNRSSGKMGIALAKEAYQQGAFVHLVIGPTKEDLSFFDGLDDIDDGKLTQINTAEELLDAVKSEIPRMNIGIFAAAVADYRPKTVESKKIKKSDDSLVLELKKNPDVLAYAAEFKDQFGYQLIGFALETDNEEENAKKKLKKKNLDYIVLNSLNDKGAGFSGDTNKVSILDRNNKLTRFELKSKAEVAKDILRTITNED